MLHYMFLIYKNLPTYGLTEDIHVISITKGIKEEELIVFCDKYYLTFSVL